MISKLKKVLKLGGFFTECFRDGLFLLRHNSHSPFADAERRLFYQIVIETHTIEKGLALPKPRPLFGQQKIQAILSMLSRYPARSDFATQMASGAFGDYVRFNQEHAPGDAFGAFVAAEATKLLVVAPEPTGGVRLAPATPLWRERELANDFLRTRFSCRMFEDERLDPGVVESAIRVAQSAPSQCNRQATKVHLYQDPAKIVALLALQGGAAGFADSVRNLLLVTSEITAWGGAQQRNQPYVDGGLFSMTVLLALHAEGIASCPLNLAITHNTERKIAIAGGLPSNERVIMMIAIGKPLASDLRAAKSPRRSIADILTVH